MNHHAAPNHVCFNPLIVKLKAGRKLMVIDETQVLHYLKTTGYQHTLLLNFASSDLEYKRFVNNYLRPSATSAVSINDEA